MVRIYCRDKQITKRSAMNIGETCSRSNPSIEFDPLVYTDTKSEWKGDEKECSCGKILEIGRTWIKLKGRSTFVGEEKSIGGLGGPRSCYSCFT